MSFLSRIKKSMGVGTISFDLDVPSHVSGNAGRLEGSIRLTAKSPQLVKDIEVIFEQSFEWDERESRYNATTKRHEDEWVARSETVELGTFTDATPFTMAEGETRSIPFAITFTAIRERPDGDPDGLVWDLLDIALSPNSSGFFGSSTRNQRTSYRVRGDVDLDGVTFDKGDATSIVVR